jgi:hypothetical protein
MEKIIDVLVQIDPEGDRIILRFGPDSIGSTVALSSDQAHILVKLILEGVTELRTANAKPEA